MLMREIEGIQKLVVAFAKRGAKERGCAARGTGARTI